ncbi:TrmH family RNA methyltransferase [Paenibacillus segetis]|nr:TrmH family RNA methyltransferase [Paenibacillus segetis]
MMTDIKSLLNNAIPTTDRRFVTEGIWAHQKLQMTDIPIEYCLFCLEMIYSNEAVELVEEFMNRTEHIYIIAPKIFQKLSDRDDPDGFMSVGILPIHDPAELVVRDDAVVVVLDGLESPGNIGTILRSCDGAGVDAVMICNPRARYNNPKMIKASMGAVFTVPIVQFEQPLQCINWLKGHNFRIYLADAEAKSCYEGNDYSGNTAIVLGSERYGISREWYNHSVQTLTIPMLGSCDSLNVGVAASILAYEICLHKRTQEGDCYENNI